MLKQLVEALFLHGRIKTTVARAKEARRLAERMVTLAKKGTLHHRRQAMAVITRKDVVNRLFDHIVEWYKERQGGYTRIIKLGRRVGDAAPMAFLELVDWIPGEKLVGQFTKIVKPETGEEEGEAKSKDKAKKAKAKEKEKKKAAKKASDKGKEKKVVKSPEKEKKISERKAEKEKMKKERAAQREKAKKERLEKKVKPKTETETKNSTKKRKKTGKSKKKTTKKSVRK